MLPETVILLEMLDARRAKKGAQYCRKHIVGKMRMKLTAQAANVVNLEPTSMLSAEFDRSRSEAAAILRRHCLNCGRCELGKE